MAGKRQSPGRTPSTRRRPSGGSVTVNAAHSPGGSFVGRAEELSRLTALWAKAAHGPGRLTMVAGEPGIGKTRLAQELAVIVESSGGRALWGRTYEDQAVPPYWPWAQAIGTYVRECEPRRLRAELGGGASVVASVIPQIRERLPALAAVEQGGDPDPARFRLYQALASFLRAATAVPPLLLVLEDLSWADKPSLELLSYVARELEGTRLLILGTYRTVEVGRKHPLVQTLADLTREQLFERNPPWAHAGGGAALL